MAARLHVNRTHVSNVARLLIRIAFDPPVSSSSTTALRLRSAGLWTPLGTSLWTSLGAPPRSVAATSAHNPLPVPPAARPLVVASAAARTAAPARTSASAPATASAAALTSAAAPASASSAASTPAAASASACASAAASVAAPAARLTTLVRGRGGGDHGLGDDLPLVESLVVFLLALLLLLLLGARLGLSLPLLPGFPLLSLFLFPPSLLPLFLPLLPVRSAGFVVRVRDNLAVIPSATSSTPILSVTAFTWAVASPSYFNLLS